MLGVYFFAMKSVLILIYVVIFTLNGVGQVPLTQAQPKDALRPISVAISIKSTVLKFLKNNIVVYRKNVPHKKPAQVIISVVEISDLEGRQRHDVVKALEGWFGVKPPIKHPLTIRAVIDYLEKGKPLARLYYDTYTGETTLTPRRIYLALSTPKVNGKGRVDVEGLVEVTETPAGREITCWEINSANRDVEAEIRRGRKTTSLGRRHERRFKGVGRQLLFSAVIRELEDFDGNIIFDLAAVYELKKEGLTPYIAYSSDELVHYVSSQYKRAFNYLERAIGLDGKERAFAKAFRMEQKPLDAPPLRLEPAQPVSATKIDSADIPPTGAVISKDSHTIATAVASTA